MMRTDVGGFQIGALLSEVADNMQAIVSRNGKELESKASDWHFVALALKR